jgi:hypothetical protein
MRQTCDSLHIRLSDWIKGGDGGYRQLGTREGSIFRRNRKKRGKSTQHGEEGDQDRAQLAFDCILAAID